MTSPAPAAYHLFFELDARFDELMAAIDHAASLFEAQPPLSWRLETNAEGPHWFRQALMDMWHVEGQDGRETRNYIAVVAADEPLLLAVEEVNRKKDAIGELIGRIKALSPHALSEAKSRLPARHPHVDDMLRKSGMARLHLKQCWRHVPIAPAPVARVRLAWYTSGRSIKKLSVRDAEKKLLQLDTDAPHIRIQLQKLAGIPSSETLAQVQAQAPLMRANLFFIEPLEDGHTRRAHNIAMPLIVPNVEARLPHIKAPNSQAPTERTRAKRRDEKLESDPFLPSLRIYRYR
ncbi:DNA replication terminus site-binding protein [Halomonas sp. PAMB 3264]|uniref:DNA replication terminus site-binding protein n=1 Tax=unclassified Halomonas TaxID=2609666 RepID=UPI00289F0005|nr:MULTISPECIES: DNA replication terminus site-binding protein [unclassified Halomonas]WNL40569.1 DNA replication terminus site-binding protein [Halomonas sp. PAMB 3232]WNL43898.1 DNA replication terminus site-binding protein [Halomonas sp. PAMB 3264]